MSEGQKDAILRGQADVRASRVTPRAKVAQSVGLAADPGGPSPRAVVWSDAARDVFRGAMADLASRDPAGAVEAATAIDRTAAGLGQAATGVDGALPFVYEKVVPQTGYVVAFELVTWTKAGEVIAILHLFRSPRDTASEKPL